MDLKKSRKGYILYFALIGLLILLGVFVVVNAMAAKQFTSSIVGEPSLNLLDTDFESEKIMIYINQAADLSIRQSLYEVTKNGGFYADSPCGRVNGYNMISLRDDCLPYPYLNVIDKLDLHMNNYLKIDQEEQIPLDNYEYTLFQQANLLSIIGTASENIEFDLLVDKSAKKVLKPSFNRLIEFDLNYLRTIREKSIELINDCFFDRAKDPNDQGINDCVRTKKKANWDLVAPVAAKEDLAQTFATIFSLAQHASTEECIASWNPNNPNLKGYQLKVLSNKVLLADDDQKQVGKDFALPSEPHYVLSMNDLPLFIRKDFTITFEETPMLITDDAKYALGNSLIFYKKEGNVGLLTADEFTSHASLYQQLPKCFHLYFVEIDPQASWFAYEETENKVAKRPVKIRFALLVDSLNELALNSFHPPTMENTLKGDTEPAPLPPEQPKELVAESVSATPEEMVTIKNCDGKDIQVKGETYQKTLQAKKIFEENGWAFCITSGYRTIEKQRELYHDPSYHACNPDQKECPHVTGKAVDIYVYDKTTKKPIAAGPYKSYRNHRFTAEQIDTHKKITELMSQAEFVGYAEYPDVTYGSYGEWWHFECCNTLRYQLAQANNQIAYGATPDIAVT